MQMQKRKQTIRKRTLDMHGASQNNPTNSEKAKKSIPAIASK